MCVILVRDTCSSCFKCVRERREEQEGGLDLFSQRSNEGGAGLFCQRSKEGGARLSQRSKEEGNLHVLDRGGGESSSAKDLSQRSQDVCSLSFPLNLAGTLKRVIQPKI